MKDSARFAPASIAPAAPLALHFVIPATNLAVRRMLHGLHLSLMANGLSQDDMEHVEIVLAEVLNNIIEHAYKGRPDCSISLSARLTPLALEIDLIDSGDAMPDHRLPSGQQGQRSAVADLPEGGFGWHLIRALTDRLDYLREDGRNHLSLHIPRSRIALAQLA